MDSLVQVTVYYLQPLMLFGVSAFWQNDWYIHQCVCILLCLFSACNRLRIFHLSEKSLGFGPGRVLDTIVLFTSLDPCHVPLNHLGM